MNRKQKLSRPELHSFNTTMKENFSSSDESSSGMFLSIQEWNKLKSCLQRNELQDENLKPENLMFLENLLTKPNTPTQNQSLTKEMHLHLQKRISAINPQRLGLGEKWVFVQTQIAAVIIQDPVSKGTEESDKTSHSDRESTFNIGKIIWICAALAAVSAILYSVFVSGTNTHLPTPEDFLLKQRNFKNEMKNVIGGLEKENSNMNFVNKSLYHFIREQKHEKPGIILLLAANSSSCSLCRLVWHFVEALRHFYDEGSQTLDYGYIPADAVSSSNENEAKRYIEDKVEGAVRNGSHWVVMEDIDKFPVRSLSKVQAYLDHENPPHKNVVYIVTAVVNGHTSKVSVENYNELSQMAKEYFDDKWIQYEKEHRRALMGRMTPALGWLNEGNFQAGNISSKQDDILSNKCKRKCR